MAEHFFIELSLRMVSSRRSWDEVQLKIRHFWFDLKKKRKTVKFSFLFQRKKNLFDFRFDKVRSILISFENRVDQLENSFRRFAKFADRFFERFVSFAEPGVRVSTELALENSSSVKLNRKLLEFSFIIESGTNFVKFSFSRFDKYSPTQLWRKTTKNSWNSKVRKTSYRIFCR